MKIFKKKKKKHLKLRGKSTKLGVCDVNNFVSLFDLRSTYNHQFTDLYISHTSEKANVKRGYK